jgi:hypothetical protein
MGDLVVRPDLLTIVFAAQVTDADPQKAIATLEKYTATILGRFQEASGGAATMKMCGSSVRPVSKGTSDEGPDVEYTVLSDGSIDVRLTPEQDYWARSRLIGAITKTARDLVDEAQAGEKSNGKAAPERSPRSVPGVHFNEPQLSVKDVDVYRPKLLERWAKKAREFADAVQAASAPLYMVDCAPPAAIEQKPISLEEIGLTLPVSCRVDALRTPAPSK